MTEQDKQTLIKIILAYLPNAQILLFGSRARKDNTHYSDVDLGFIPYGRFDRYKITRLNEMIENSTIPYKVEIINLGEVSEDFKKEVLKDAVIWKD